MLLRRILAGCLLFSLAAPALVPASSGGSGPAGSLAPSGTGCCASMPCCATGVRCAEGNCANPAAPSGDASEEGSRFAAGCPGPAPGAPAADRDPMVAAPIPTPPAPRPRADAPPSLVRSTSDRADDPAEPPPRA